MKFTKLFIISIVFFFGCSKKSIVRKYYVLETPAITEFSTRTEYQPLPLKVVVKDLQVAKAFDQTRIALRSDSHELKYYYYHHWAVRPSYAVSNMIYELIKESGLFQRVFYGYAPNPDYIVQGEIFKIEKTVADSARLEILLELIDAKTNLAVLNYKINSAQKLGKNSMNEYAKTTSNMLAVKVNDFLVKINQHFEK